ncbi:MAG: cyclic nucleotide-binding domain-containing protein [Desulfuromonadaceae bacterium]|nr:cyclic nucleotide-binding domain-containing protein [Desulfuromonadaceae bacterium]
MTEFFKDVEGCPLLNGLDAIEKNHLLASFSVKKLPQGKVVFLENMPGESLYIILSGSVKVSRKLTDGKEKTLTVLGPQEMFGEMAILGETVRAATISVVEDSEFLCLGKQEFDLLCTNQPQVALKILKNLLFVVARKSRESLLDENVFLKWCFGEDGSMLSRAS